MDYNFNFSESGFFSIFRMLDSMDQKNFELFSSSRVSVRTLTLTSTLGAFYAAYFFALALSHYSRKSDMLIVTLAIAIGFRLPCFYTIAYVKNAQKKGITSPIIEKMAPWIPYLESYLPAITSLNVGLCLISRALYGACSSFRQDYVYSCNTGLEANTLPIEHVILAMLLPIIHSVVYKSIKNEWLWVSWAIAVVCISISIYLADAIQAIPALVLYAPFSAIILYENHRQNLILFFVLKRQDDLLTENKQLSEETQSELRHMIANVAHDLKTPLSAFMNCVEIISDQIPKPSDESVALSNSTAGAIQENLKNLFNINSFMTMTINRCIDYTKASKGLKLDPRLETINLQDILSLPINCMKDMQNRVTITQERLPDNITTNLITDKQWLQENLFCLISNAVKYSGTGSMVTVSARLVDAKEAELSSKAHTFNHNNISKHMRNSDQGSEISYAQQSTVPMRVGLLDRLNGMKVSPAVESEPLVQSGTSADGKGSSDGGYNGPPVAGGNKSGLLNGHSHSTGLHQRSYSIDEQNELDESLDKVILFKPGDDRTLISRPEENNKVSSSARSTNTVAYNGSTKTRPLAENPHTPSTPASQQQNSAATSSALPHITIPQAAGTVAEAATTTPIQNAMFLMFEIEDSGIGMSDEAMTTLFTPFKQAQRRAGGTGLGLYSLAKRVEALKGHFGVYRRKDGKEGSVFWFAVPYIPDLTCFSGDNISQRIKSPSNSEKLTYGSHNNNNNNSNSNSNSNHNTKLSPIPTAGNSKSSDHQDGSGSLIPKLSILVVDDSVSILKMTSMMLRKQGHVVSQAENGAEALTHIAAGRTLAASSEKETKSVYDIVLMDLNMPVMDGLEATRRLRALETKHNTAPGCDTIHHQFVIAFSANSDHVAMLEAFEAGVDDFISKPFAMQTFYDCYAKYSQNKNSKSVSFHR